jgi:hypothetical protein
MSGPLPALKLEGVQVCPKPTTWIYLLMSGGGTHYAITLVSTPNKMQTTDILTGFGRGEIVQPKGKIVFLVTYKRHDLVHFITMYADPALIEKHWEDFRKLLRSACRYESRRAAIDPKPEAASGVTA